MKKFLTPALVAVMAFALAAVMALGLAVPAMAEYTGTDGNPVYLKGQSNAAPTGTWDNVFFLGGTGASGSTANLDELPADVNVWQLSYADSDAVLISMRLAFTNGQIFDWDPSMGLSDKNNSNKNHSFWIVVAPSDWQLAYIDQGDNKNVSDSYAVTTDTGKAQFNLIGFRQGKAPAAGAVTVTASVVKAYNQTDNYYERNVDNYYERNVDNYYDRSVDNYYVRDVQDLYTRDVQDFKYPAFEKKISSASGTLVTRLDYSGDTAKAVPTNGGAFNNGQTYVAVDVAAASAPDGVWYGIADSSKNNGKKTPADYNIPIGYQYNVKIAGGKLTVSFDDRLISASVGAYVAANPAKFPGNAPAHTDGSCAVDMPAAYDNGVVYLYFHCEGVKWYTTGSYEFAGWKTGTSTGDYELTGTVTGDYSLVNTVDGEYDLADTVTGEYGLVNTVNGEYELAGTSGPIAEQTPYDNLTLTVDGAQEPLGRPFGLEPGTHAFVLSGGDADAPFEQSQNVTVNPGANTFDFGDISVPVADIVNDHYADRPAADHYADIVNDHYADRPAADHYADNKLPDRFGDNILPAVTYGSEDPEDPASIQYGVYTPARQ